MLIITMLSAVLTVFLHNHRGSDKELKDIPYHFPEPHWEETYYQDYLGLNRDKTTASASGTSTVLTFGKDHSNS